jgi:hypothetical protein
LAVRVYDARFFTDALGLVLTDRSKMMAFVRTNDDYHWIAIADAAVSTLNHIAFQMPTLESVMRAAGRMVDHRFPIGWGPGGGTDRATTCSPISSTRFRVRDRIHRRSALGRRRLPRRRVGASARRATEPMRPAAATNGVSRRPRPRSARRRNSPGRSLDAF